MTDPDVWTPEDLLTIAASMHGSAVGAVPALAGRLGVDERVVRRWASGAPIPPGVVREIEELAGMHAPPETRWRRDEWIVGEGLIGVDGWQRAYVLHTWPPRFRCRAVVIGDDGRALPAEEPVDLLTGLTFSMGGEIMLAEFDWVDRPPSGARLAALLEAAANALVESGLE